MIEAATRLSAAVGRWPDLGIILVLLVAYGVVFYLCSRYASEVASLALPHALELVEMPIGFCARHGDARVEY
ncbi:MAG TPA: hypothetical protein VFY10_01095 [Dehalococcoidia bacterium]|nr:hypothetical protein [Dehalococcoidia bacterium]